MGMILLSLPDEEDAIDISRVDEQLSADEADMELPGEVTEQDNMRVLVDGALALEGIRHEIVRAGVNREKARGIFGIIAGMGNPGIALEAAPLYHACGGNHVFTYESSIEGLHVAVESIKETIKSTFKKILERIVAVYKAFIEWVQRKIARQDVQNLTPSTKTKDVLKRSNAEAIAKLLDGLSDNPDLAAGEVARMADGDTTKFANALKQEFENMQARLGKFFESIAANRAHVRLATGDVSVKDLMAEEADAAINKTIVAASSAAQAVLTARNSAALSAAVERAKEASAALDEVSSVTFDTGGEYEGKEAGVKIGTIMHNLRTAVRDTESVDIAKMASELESRMTIIMRSAEQTSRQEIEELIPEDVDDDLRQQAIATVTALYAKMAGAGKTIASLWGVRINSLKAINVILENISDIITSLERSIERLAGALEPEQKEVLQKALAAKGIVVEM